MTVTHTRERVLRAPSVHRLRHRCWTYEPWSSSSPCTSASCHTSWLHDRSHSLPSADPYIQDRRSCPDSPCDREIAVLTVSFHYEQCFNCITVRTNSTSENLNISFRVRKFDNFIRCDTVGYYTYTLFLQEFGRHFCYYTPTRSCNLRQIFYFRNLHLL